MYATGSGKASVCPVLLEHVHLLRDMLAEMPAPMPAVACGNKQKFHCLILLIA